MEITVDFYNNALYFALNIIKRRDYSDFIDKKDIVHDVICDCAFSENSWKSLVVTYVYRYKISKFIYNIDSVPKNKEWIEHRYCKCCDNVMPEDYFISGYHTITKEAQYRKLCKYCYRTTDKYKEEKKRYYEKHKDELRSKAKERRKKYVDKTAKERYERWKINHKKSTTI